MYGLAGERRLTGRELGWLCGYRDSRPVRTGNAAHGQLQIDVYGEMMDALNTGRRFGLEPDDDSWRIQQTMLHYLESSWADPDEGIWEIRGPRRHFTHSQVMAWVVFGRAVAAGENFGPAGPGARRRELPHPTPP